jgi:hypothetical protein
MRLRTLVFLAAYLIPCATAAYGQQIGDSDVKPMVTVLPISGNTITHVRRVLRPRGPPGSQGQTAP